MRILVTEKLLELWNEHPHLWSLTGVGTHEFDRLSNKDLLELLIEAVSDLSYDAAVSDLSYDAE